MKFGSKKIEVINSFSQEFLLIYFTVTIHIKDAHNAVCVCTCMCTLLREWAQIYLFFASFSFNVIGSLNILLLCTGMDVETRLGFEWTPLMCAVHAANYDLAKLLLDRGASANFSKSKKNMDLFVFCCCCCFSGEGLD